ncbi:MAG TPA: SurA N-terminal domain-containing protein [Candidatus Angelobacter sp.]|nr:SurA N-terminal domain-containing protein [Candidatus Angelobacter sp.]
MRRLFQFAILACLATLAQGQVVDRMVAVVNKHVILQSELDQAARVELLMQGKPIAMLAQSDRSAILERLIDRALLDQQIANPEELAPTPAELADRNRELRQSVLGSAVADNARWNAALASYGLTQQDLDEQLTAEVRILRFVDLRFRGLVRVEKDDIAAYYQDKFLPEVRKRNAAEPALAEVSARIEQVLAEQRVDAMLADWLKTLRAQAHIEKMLPAPPAAAAGANP